MLKGKTALITGSTSGIGLAAAKVLATEGADIVLHGLMTPADGEELASQFTAKYGVKTLFSNADLKDIGEITKFIETANATMGGIDILVNNAGIQHTENIENFPAQKWQDIIAINLSAAFFTTQQLLPTMKAKGWGRIINIASVHGLVASVNKSAYCAAKHGLVGLTKATALECAELGITANAICPGWVDTPLINDQIQQVAIKNDTDFTQAKYQLITAKQPLPEMASAEQIGHFIAFLCSDNAKGITGAAMPIDGAWTAQ